MANQFRISANLQNTWDAGPTHAAVRHKVPELAYSETGVVSAVVELTGTSVGTIGNNGGDLEVNGAAVFDPTDTLTGIRISHVLGWAVYVQRAAAATAPTGSVNVTVASFGEWLSDGAIPLKDGGCFIWHNPNAGVSADTDLLTVSLSGTTGYKVSVIAYCTPE